jgi:hypothetical protein
MSFVCTLNKNPIKDIISRLEGDTRFRNPVHHVQTRDYQTKEKGIIPSSPLNGGPPRTSRVSPPPSLDKKNWVTKRNVKMGRYLHVERKKIEQRPWGIVKSVRKRKRKKVGDPSVHHDNACRGRQK